MGLSGIDQTVLRIIIITGLIDPGTMVYPKHPIDPTHPLYQEQSFSTRRYCLIDPGGT